MNSSLAKGLSWIVTINTYFSKLSWVHPLHCRANRDSRSTLTDSRPRSGETKPSSTRLASTTVSDIYTFILYWFYPPPPRPKKSFYSGLNPEKNLFSGGFPYKNGQLFKRPFLISQVQVHLPMSMNHCSRKRSASDRECHKNNLLCELSQVWKVSSFQKSDFTKPHFVV